MLKRKITEKLKAWKNSPSNRALLVAGARQVGKSYIIEKFVSDSYEHYVKFDFIQQPDLLRAVQNCNNADELFVVLSAYGGEEFIAGDSCIFIDEIQEYEQAITFVKYLTQIEGFDFIFSGSLLGVELRNVRSQPVGYMDTIELFPLDFEEFCWAMNIGDQALKHVRESFNTRTPVIQPVYEKLLSLFHMYLIVGGMPAAVDMFVNTKNLAEVKTIQNGITTLYRADISKYTKKNTLLIKEIYDQIPAQLSSQSKKFNFASLAPKGTYARYLEEFIWMIDAGVALPVVNVAEPSYPLKMSEKKSFFKLFANDVGLLCALCEMDISKNILSDNLGVNYGSIYENAIAQELKAHGKQLRFFRNKQMGEVDFIIEKGDGTVLPIEVKSGKDYKRHSALTKMMNTDNYAIDDACVLCEDNVSTSGKITYLPVFMVMYIE